jgi:hypothetical protein
VGVPPRRLCDTPLSEKVSTKIRQPVAVAQSVEFACGLKVTEFLLLVVHRIKDQIVANLVLFNLATNEIIGKFSYALKMSLLKSETL